MSPGNSSTLSFIESQFPVSKVSKESYKERKAGVGQTLTGLGKWWGRKPLILVRAAVIGLLMPASDDPARDREVFLKILTMDDEGMWQRKRASIPAKVLAEYLSPRERAEYLDGDRLRSGLSRQEKEELQQTVFLRMSYDERLGYCYRPEEIEGPSPEAWAEINAHLGTHASSLQELVEELGTRQFGERPSVGDCFCGGGSVPFEAARIGCDAYASDLNPVATLLTWSALNIIGGGEEVVGQVKRTQSEVYSAVDRQIIEWGIEENEQGWRADAYLYCNEVVCPECGWHVPLLPTMIIGKKTKTVVTLKPLPESKKYALNIVSGVTSDELEYYDSLKTISDSEMICPNPDCPGHIAPISMSSIRREHTGGLRFWENGDVVPRPDDVFQERLYCIRWIEEYTDASGKINEQRHYMVPTAADLEREERVLALLQEQFHAWQEQGYIPSMAIEPGEETSRLYRERGWTHWHHLFTPRQLLILGLFGEVSKESASGSIHSRVENLLEVGRLAETKGVGCRLLRWNPHPSKEGHASVFSNQALNTLYNYCHRTIKTVEPPEEKCRPIEGDFNLSITPASTQSSKRSYWITDPPYADAINYHELSEFFLAWYEKPLKELFPDWPVDSRRALAITGTDEGFRRNMVEVYANLTRHMPDNGAQIVMFTHQDAGVWADLAMILWTAGLQVTAAWCVITETDSEQKKGNYVQGTVLLVLRKQTSEETAFLDELAPEVEDEVKRQLDAMLALDDQDDPNFADTDYQLAAYAAALRVLTKYRKIEDIDIMRELYRTREAGEKNPLEGVIENAVKIACDHLVPKNIDGWIWSQLGPEERFYLKGLEMESHGEYRIGAYQELAKGFGIRDYRNLQARGRANEMRLKTASEFRDRDIGGEGFGSSLTRQVLFAIRQAVEEENAAAGRVWLRTLPSYWEKRRDIIAILRYLAALGISDSMPQWKKDAEAADILAVAVEGDHV
jgi:putative DNA methylase